MLKAATDTALTLCAFRADGAALSGGTRSAPTRLVVAPLGSHDARGRGKVIVSAATLEGFAERQAAAKLGTRLALDFEHETVPGTPAYAASQEPRNIAAWATCSAVPGEGLVYHDIEWTPMGLRAWKRKLFQDISPAVFRRADGTVIALHSAALCRHGEIDGLTISAAAAGPQLAPFFAALSASLPSESAPMKPTPELIALFTALGMTLAADADEATVTTALKDAVAKIEAAAKKAPDAMSADMQAIEGRVTALSTEVKTLQGERDELKRAELIRQATAEGKIIPLSAETLKNTPLDVLADIVKQAKPGEVPLNAHQTGKETKGSVEAFSAASIARLEAMGLKPEDVAKYAPQCLPAA
ncbi:phage protease [Prosthecobacter dejongeii]|uniref:Phage I-like protein n=1 Tax=Prosthecobacter dejongeii TaxID=48465 RepID=A0A7W8DPN8_9BACT|nr:phage protease [Prosthecobacter dejongeii]MBB5037116.1 phage I-like protein [Prosthecobacter dejongeii]